MASVLLFLVPLCFLAAGPMPLYSADNKTENDLEGNPSHGRQLLHTMLRVADLDRSIAFYCDVLGMHVLRQSDFPLGRFTLVFIGYGPESSHTVLELTYNWDQDNYVHGEAFGHIAIAVDDIEKAVEAMKERGVTVTREPGPMKFGGRAVIAFIQDPDGYVIELIERA
ncbi:MAG: lactoylglutathione lyase [Waddliaceae bacterium]